MKSGLTIVEMAQQIERQSKLKQDYLLDTRRLQVEPFGSQLYLHTFDDHDDPLVEPLEINQIAHRQIGTHLKIPAAYYDRMLSDYPELLAENVNSWFQREPTQRMVRTLDGTVRAFLSNRYRRIDNLDIAEIVLPVIQQMEDAYFESCQITDSRMYIKVVNKRLEAELQHFLIGFSGHLMAQKFERVKARHLVQFCHCRNCFVHHRHRITFFVHVGNSFLT